MQEELRAGQATGKEVRAANRGLTADPINPWLNPYRASTRDDRCLGNQAAIGPSKEEAKAIKG